MPTLAQKRREERIAKLKAARVQAEVEAEAEAVAAVAEAVTLQEQQAEGQDNGSKGADAGVAETWIGTASDRMKQGDGEWVKLGEHLTRQSAEHGRARLRRRLLLDGRADDFELWVTVDSNRISKKILKAGDANMAKAAELGKPRPKMRRPAAVFGRWVGGTIEPESVQQRQAGRAGGHATREANAVRVKVKAGAG